MVSGNRDADTPVSLPFFDPRPSARFGAEILTESGVRFALIGKVAMWTHLPGDAQEWTKDVDFAVPTQAIEPIRAALAGRGIVPRELPIGGLGVREGEIRIDFIDRHEGGLDRLFEEAIDDAAKNGSRARLESVDIPVARVEYLIALKVVTGEDKDEHDVVRLLAVLPNIDIRLARALIERHGGTGSANRFDALARRAGRPDARPEYRNGG
jgi:hypothetical protein